MNYASRYRKLPANPFGRDFAVSDIHACFDLVLRAMERVKFDPAVDRLFVVGDCIDRGPHSARVVRFLQEPYVFAVLGNHEAMVLDLYAEGEPAPAVLEFAAARNGFDWWLSTPDSVRQDVLDAVRYLPYILETDTRRGTVGFLHAEVPTGMSWSEVVAAVQRGEPKTTETVLWGRKRINQQDRSGVPGIGRLFVGHTPVLGPQRLGNVYYLDTGAVFGVLDHRSPGRLTIGDLCCATAVLVAPADEKPADLVDARVTQSSTPFSAYMPQSKLGALWSRVGPGRG